ncbi:hypothetical protein RclHR1_09930004 [Rhizophagus clarus]|uniref:Uncharacterized protein n=1 Tax=Rhizophagus clarus TaxID=94130 RepID=A0A2Z6SRH1_9GLOM|nr:hypothetical protein RclHR1_09930004 [Rhizophagus clarus]
MSKTPCSVLNSKIRGKKVYLPDDDESLISTALSLVWTKTDKKINSCTFEQDRVKMSYKKNEDLPTNDIVGLKSILAEIEVYKEIDVEQGIRQTFEDDLIKNKNNIQVYMSKSVTTDMKKMMEKIVKMILTKNKAQLDEIENKIQNLANIVESKKTRNIYQLSDLFGMGIRVDDKLVFYKKYQKILVVK